LAVAGCDANGAEAEQHHRPVARFRHTLAGETFSGDPAQQIGIVGLAFNRQLFGC
jgi:hypothetical protein